MQTRAYRLSGLVAVLGLLTLLTGWLVILLAPTIGFAALAILALGVLLLITAFLMDFRRVGSALAGKRGRFGTGTTVMVSIFIGIILVINAISIGNYHRFDVTGVAQFTLTSQTKEVLGQLEAPVQVYVFLVPGDPFGDFIMNLLNEYQNQTDQLSVEAIDPDEHPDQARQYGIMMYPSVVFETEQGRRLVSPLEIAVLGTDQEGNQQLVGVEAEHPFTSAILEVTGIMQKKVYFLTGHGESSITTDYRFARDALLDNLYNVEPLNLLLSSGIPEDATAVIIAGAQRSLKSEEVEILENYLENDGWLMILTNPEAPPEIEQLLSAWGVEIEDGTIIDPSSYLSPSKDIPLVTWQRNFMALPELYFPGATAIIPQPGYIPIPVEIQPGIFQFIWMSENSPLTLVSLVRTSQDSWLDSDFDPAEEPEFNEEIDLAGSLNIGFLITNIPADESEERATEEVKGPRLLVFGDSDFATDQHFYNGYNADLFLNSVNRLTQGTELISIERKVLPFRRLIIGPEATRFIEYSSVGLVPLIVLVVGGIIWWRRRQ